MLKEEVLSHGNKTFRNIAKKSVGGHQLLHGDFSLFSPVPVVWK